MRPVNERHHTAPLLPVEWEEVCHKLGLPLPRSHARGPAQPSDRGQKPVRFPLNGFPQKVSDAAGLVTFEESFCTITSDDDNLTWTMNKALKVKPWDGCLQDGKVHPVTNEYFKIWPAVIQVVTGNINTLIHADSRDEIRAWLTRQQESFAVRATENVKTKHYLLIWSLTDNVRKTNLTEKNVLNLPTNGRVKKDDQSDSPGVVIVATEKTKVQAKKLEKLLKAKGPCHTVIEENRQVHELQQKLQSCLACVIYVGSGLDALALGHLAGYAHPERLFLLADAAETDSVKLIQRLGKRMNLDAAHQFEMGPGSLDAVAEVVTGSITRARTVEDMRRHIWRAWRQAEAGIRQVIESGTAETEIEIIEAAVIRPLQDRVMELGQHRFTSVESIQNGFVRVAEHVFKRAKRVYALNTDIHSIFWAGLDNETRMKYLTQVRTTRLFLYSTPANVFHDIDGELKFQASHYGNNATLLVGDLDRYRVAFGDAVDEDVAFILHECGIWYRFFLNRQRFGYEVLGEQVADSRLTRLMNIEEQVKPQDPVAFQNFGYFQWHANYQTTDAFLNCMENVFRSNFRSGVHRVLTFQNDGQIPPKEFRRMVLRAHRALEEHENLFKQRNKLKSIEYGSLSHLHEPVGVNADGDFGHVRDRRNASHLHEPVGVNADINAPSILILHFDSTQHLKEFYDSDELKQVRANLYRDILTAIKIETGDLNDVAVERLFEVMEKAGNRYITRRTYTDQHDLRAWLDLMSHARRS